MAKRAIGTVTQNGMTQSQPGTNVSSCNDWRGERVVYVLSVSRYYPDLKNKMGGLGVFKKLDCDGMEFPTSEAAHQFAHERGYTREYFTAPDLRARNVARGDELKARAIDFKKRLANGTLFS